MKMKTKNFKIKKSKKKLAMQKTHHLHLERIK